MRYKITITTGAHTSTVWVQANSKQEAVAQVSVTGKETKVSCERDSINKRMMQEQKDNSSAFEYDSTLSTEKHTVTA